MRWFAKRKKPILEISWPERVAAAEAHLVAHHGSCDENCPTWVLLREIKRLRSGGAG